VPSQQHYYGLNHLYYLTASIQRWPDSREFWRMNPAVRPWNCGMIEAAALAKTPLPGYS
jgi:hypothetical protein